MQEDIALSYIPMLSTDLDLRYSHKHNTLYYHRFLLQTIIIGTIR